MGKLKGRGLPSRLSPGRSRLWREGKQGQAPRRSVNWLNTTQWQKLRLKILARDGYICQQTGVALVGSKHAPNSPVVDHIVPHRGDPDLFWNDANLQSVCKAWHDQEKQRQEKNGLA